MNSTHKETIHINANGRELFGVIRLPRSHGSSMSKACPIVIFSHGYNGSHEDFDTESAYLNAHGIATCSFDFCGGSVGSKSSLKTTEMTLFTEKEDLSAVIAHLQSDARIDRNNIFLFGASQGGMVSALTAEAHAEDVKGMLLLFPAFCIADNWNDKFPDAKEIPDVLEFWGMALGSKFFKSLRGFEVFKQIGTFSRAVQIFNGDQDQVATVAYSEKARDLYPHATLEVFSGEGHGFSEKGKKRVAEMTLQFVTQHLD